MKFRTEAKFDHISLEDFEELYFNEDFNQAMCKRVNLSRIVVRMERDDEKLDRVLRIGPDRELPTAVKKVLKADRLEYEERLSYRWGSYEAKWETVPSVLASKVDARGSIKFQKAGDGVLRIADGEIQVKLLGVGGMVEKLVVADVEKSFKDAADFTQQWIDERLKA